MRASPTMDFFATAAKGTEPALRDELRALRLRGVRADRGGVHFSGALRDGFRACLWSRVAVRVLTPLARFAARTGDELYEGVASVDWSPYLDPQRTLVVSSACKSSALTHTQYIAQRTKDAIVDRLRARDGARPSVDRADPDVHVFLHLVKDEATVYLDLAGEPLHRRGWRTAAREAPLKETLAAAVLLLAGYDGTTPLLDPMCGAGTLLIEGALLARGVAPGSFRERFGFERWKSHGDAEAREIRVLRDEARESVRAEGPEIFGSDIDPDALAVTRENAARASVLVRLSTRSLDDCHPPIDTGTLVTNPPYGVRIHGEGDVPADLGALVDRLAGFRVGILAGGPELVRHVRRRAEKALVLYNGDIECRLVRYAPE